MLLLGLIWHFGFLVRRSYSSVKSSTTTLVVSALEPILALALMGQSRGRITPGAMQGVCQCVTVVNSFTQRDELLLESRKFLGGVRTLSFSPHCLLLNLLTSSILVVLNLSS